MQERTRAERSKEKAGKKRKRGRKKRSGRRKLRRQVDRKERKKNIAEGGTVWEEK